LKKGKTKKENQGGFFLIIEGEESITKRK